MEINQPNGFSFQASLRSYSGLSDARDIGKFSFIGPPPNIFTGFP